MIEKRLYIKRWVGLLLLCAAVLALITMPPFVTFRWKFIVMKAFSAVCHQLPERSFHIHDVGLAVCHRCTGIYLGVFIGALFITPLSRLIVANKKLALLACITLIIMGIDWGLPWTGFATNTTVSQFITGLFFGFSAGGWLGQAVVHKEALHKLAEIDIQKSNFV